MCLAEATQTKQLICSANIHVALCSCQKQRESHCKHQWSCCQIQQEGTASTNEVVVKNEKATDYVMWQLFATVIVFIVLLLIWFKLDVAKYIYMFHVYYVSSLFCATITCMLKKPLQTRVHLILPYGFLQHLISWWHGSYWLIEILILLRNWCSEV